MNSKPHGHKVAEWSANPDMGDIQDPAKAVCTECQHGKHLHYGDSRNWCNLQGCQCQEFQGDNEEKGAKKK